MKLIPFYAFLKQYNLEGKHMKFLQNWCYCQNVVDEKPQSILDSRPESIREQLEKSLERLKVDFIDSCLGI